MDKEDCPFILHDNLSLSGETSFCEIDNSKCRPCEVLRAIERKRNRKSDKERRWF